ncbi:MAG: ATP-binding cassette domain-containing protein, partial [Bacteroidota bacterium]
MADHKIIFSMERVSKTFPGASKKVLNNIWLSFYYGAKIGVLGLNGSGKSTLLKIIAGVDKNFQGNVVFNSEYKIGYLEQEPELDPEKTVREVVEEAVQETVDLMKEYDEVNLKFAEPMSDDEMNKLIARQAELMEELENRNAWELDNKLNTALEALRCPPDDAKVEVLS